MSSRNVGQQTHALVIHIARIGIGMRLFSDFLIPFIVFFSDNQRLMQQAILCLQFTCISWKFEARYAKVLFFLILGS